MTAIRVRRGTAADWTAGNPVLALGEPGLETDTRKVKYGDGSTAWNSLGYAVAAVSVTWGSIGGTLSSQTDLLAALNARLAAASNLSDLASAATARTNLGLGSLATQSGTFSGASSGTNTGDQTTITGNAGTATTLQTARNINGVSFNGSANITVPAVDTATPRLAAANNLSDVASAGTARANLRSSCRVTLSASLSGNDFTAGYVVPWNTETYDDANWHDNSTNPERMTVPAGVDRVEFIVGLRLTGLTASAPVLIQVLKNGSTAIAAQNTYTSGTTQLVQFGAADSCTAGDYYTVKVTQTGGTVSGTVASAASSQFVAKAV
jgi:hypothetical protein